MNIPAIERPGWIEPKNAGRFTDNQIISDNVRKTTCRSLHVASYLAT